MDDSKRRWRWIAEQKPSILQEARQAGHTVSEVRRRHQIQPTQFYLWEKQVKAGALAALRAASPGRPKAGSHRGHDEAWKRRRDRHGATSQ